MTGLAVLLGLGLVACVTAGVGYTVYALTRPPRRTYAHAVARRRPGQPRELPAHADGSARRFDEWTFRSRGHDLPVWEIEGDEARGPVLVMTHGWGDSRVGALPRAAALLPVCARIVMWDLPGHGEAPGTSSLGTHEVGDLLELLTRLGVGRAGERSLSLLGWSLGAGVSIAAAARRPDGIACVIAEAPYRVPRTPARNVLKIRGLPYRWNVAPAFAWLGLRFGVGMGWRGFDRAGLARDVVCPLLVVHGQLDDVSPIEDGRAIAAAAKDGAIVEIPDAGHHGLWTEPASAAVCVGAVREFFARVAG